jgi:hypothetical protein
MSVMDDGSLNLNVVNEAYGVRSDLYMDVLQVQPNAGASQIQEAYFDRRNELFQLLADIDHTGDDSVMESHRQQAERKMDAVVCAVRILGDPDLRLQYDDLRTERTRLSHSSYRRPRPHPDHVSRKLHPAAPSHVDSVWENVESSSPPGLLNVSGTSMNSSTFYTDFSISSRSKGTADGTIFTSPTVEENDRSSRYSRNQSAKAPLSRKNLAQPPPYPSSKQPRNASVERERNRGGTSLHPVSLLRKVTSSSVDGDASTQLSKESTNYYDDDDDFDEDETFYTLEDGESTTGGKGRTSKASSSGDGFLDRLRAELLGAIDDTAMALEQVLNAFTLQEADIRAVMGRIDKAKLQMATTHVFYPSTNPKGSGYSKKSSKGKKDAETTSPTDLKSLKGRKSPFSTSSKSSSLQPSIGKVSRRQEMH